jgi:hypothetical protein
MLADKQLRSTPREGRAEMPAGQLSVRVCSPVARGPEPFSGLYAGEHKIQERVDQWSAAHRVSTVREKVTAVKNFGTLCLPLCTPMQQMSYFIK